MIWSVITCTHRLSLILWLHAQISRVFVTVPVHAEVTKTSDLSFPCCKVIFSISKRKRKLGSSDTSINYSTQALCLRRHGNGSLCVFSLWKKTPEVYSTASRDAVRSFEQKMEWHSCWVIFQGQSFLCRGSHIHWKCFERQLAITELHFSFQSFKAWIKFPQWLLSFFNSTLG